MLTAWGARRAGRAGRGRGRFDVLALAPAAAVGRRYLWRLLVEWRRDEGSSDGPGSRDDDAAGDGEAGGKKGKNVKGKKGPTGPPTLTQDDFGSSVLKSQDAWMVLYRDGVALEEEGDGVVPADWAKVAAKADGLISAAEVDCQASPKLCSRCDRISMAASRPSTPSTSLLTAWMPWQ